MTIRPQYHEKLPSQEARPLRRLERPIQLVRTMLCCAIWILSAAGWAAPQEGSEEAQTEEPRAEEAQTEEAQTEEAQAQRPGISESGKRLAATVELRC